MLSDWGGTHTTAKAALAGLDNEEPAAIAQHFFGDALKKAVESGEVPWRASTTWCIASCARSSPSGIVDDPPQGRVVDPFRGADTAQDDRRTGFGAAEERQRPASAECRDGEIHRR